MCGIVGVIAKSPSGLFKGQVDLFQQIFLVDQIRGTDGAGIIMDTKEGMQIHKAPYGAGPFMNTDEFKAAMELAVKESHFIIGHNRAATKGEHTWQNTHPFVEKNIYLVHNGTLWDHKNLDKEVVVDSHAICRHMAQNGAKETLKEIDGAFALVWVDEDEYTINLARNKERPLHLIETTGFWIISSELGLGLWMAERHKLIVVDSFPLETETLYTFDLDKPYKYSTEKVQYMPPYAKGVYTFGSWIKGPNTTDGGTGEPFQSRRHRKGKKSKGSAASNVVPFDQREKAGKETVFSTPTRGYGDTIKFSPNPLDKKDKYSSILFDTTEEKKFLLGQVHGEKDTEVRVYARPEILDELAGCDLIEGTVIRTRIRGSRTTYDLNNINVIWNHMEKDTVANELALNKYCDNNGLSNDPQTLIKCACCDFPTKRSSITMRAGKPLCVTCNTTMAENPKLAQEFGYK